MSGAALNSAETSGRARLTDARARSSRAAHDDLIGFIAASLMNAGDVEAAAEVLAHTRVETAEIVLCRALAAIQASRWPAAAAALRRMLDTAPDLRSAPLAGATPASSIRKLFAQVLLAWTLESVRAEDWTAVAERLREAEGFETDPPVFSALRERVSTSLPLASLLRGDREEAIARWEQMLVDRAHCGIIHKLFLAYLHWAESLDRAGRRRRGTGGGVEGCHRLWCGVDAL